MYQIWLVYFFIVFNIKLCFSALTNIAWNVEQIVDKAELIIHKGRLLIDKIHVPLYTIKQSIKKQYTYTKGKYI